MTTQKQPAVPVSGIASWWEILVPDLDAAVAFYEAAFGWASTPFGDDFRMLTDHDGAMVAGLEHSDLPATSAPARLRIYLGTDDLEAVLDQVGAAGDDVRDDRTPIGGDTAGTPPSPTPSATRSGSRRPRRRRDARGRSCGGAPRPASPLACRCAARLGRRHLARRMERWQRD